ncbi:hypothetical protein HRUBRA_02628 [Pseudohaliea rubra DSM 19751]|uniref:Uncharacterized protein n=1 Tax=Pseudohaliea rubra DSM 19751 TaxID=1265313 RepID=A0A095VMS6_9GAMM|nr:hypothetical protein HRUBRA_02628 [Pseudohaliea rubra DSM 19751]
MSRSGRFHARVATGLGEGGALYRLGKPSDSCARGPQPLAVSPSLCKFSQS